MWEAVTVPACGCRDALGLCMPVRSIVKVPSPLPAASTCEGRHDEPRVVAGDVSDGIGKDLGEE
jgi:hypothetical protein